MHYDRYNNRYGSDGIHEAIDWSKWNTDVEEFRDKFILPSVVETEKKEKSYPFSIMSLVKLVVAKWLGRHFEFKIVK